MFLQRDETEGQDICCQNLCFIFSGLEYGFPAATLKLRFGLKFRCHGVQRAALGGSAESLDTSTDPSRDEDVEVMEVKPHIYETSVYV